MNLKYFAVLTAFWFGILMSIIIVEYPTELAVRYPSSIENEINCLNANCTSFDIIPVTNYAKTGSLIIAADICICITLFLLIIYLLGSRNCIIIMCTTYLVSFITGIIAFGQKCNLSTCFDKPSLLYMTALFNIVGTLLTISILFFVNFYKKLQKQRLITDDYVSNI